MGADNIILYGAEQCHKTQFYLDFLKEKKVAFAFFDVTKNKEKQQELRALFASGKANFPTFLIGHKRLRNPKIGLLEKWLDRAEAANYVTPDIPKYDSAAFQFTCGIVKKNGDVSDSIEY
ncbi:MAG: arsenate reductase-like glutaredoxin family protein [Vicingaceae bacterium]|jgi:arsenate reductase-like glutaredoxin family protein